MVVRDATKASQGARNVSRTVFGHGSARLLAI